MRQKFQALQDVETDQKVMVLPLSSLFKEYSTAFCLGDSFSVFM